MPYTNREKAECAKREVKQRVRVYGRRVEDGNMTEAFAAEQIALMSEIAAEYEEKAKADELHERLL